MNIIQHQVIDFVRTTPVPHSNYRLYLDSVKSWLYEINEEGTKYELLSELIKHFKQEMDEKVENTLRPDKSMEIDQYKVLIFRLNDELNGIREYVSKKNFFENEKSKLDEKLDEILCQLQTLKNGQEIIYEDLTKELNEMKEFYFLNKKTWKELLIGKLFSMVNSGVISLTVSQKIVNIINDEYANLIDQI
ncbi:hypothetical protein CW751_09890 [Brumimicrobium salinarum]|uniref:Uncharacterized protein n=1 Tax=Brumimicrobium salinarum TaxID=2058658 RepID=A0A2I0R1B9_9FLAO|nr:hypothetical protein [Brumimicrobium salinarum]PKR80374.1 hypothetical protein CW751_09890 [Brumimicrobium salinarum]